MVASAFGSLAMMTSVLVSPDGTYNYEAAHGTVQKHYYKHLEGQKTSSNSMALIYAWTGALRKRGELDGLADLVAFAGGVERASLDTIAAGVMTGDLARLSNPPAKQVVASEEFLDAIAARLRSQVLA
jgi:isocitrate dehydrogenase